MCVKIDQSIHTRSPIIVCQLHLSKGVSIGIGNMLLLAGMKEMRIDFQLWVTDGYVGSTKKVRAETDWLKKQAPRFTWGEGREGGARAPHSLVFVRVWRHFLGLLPLQLPLTIIIWGEGQWGEREPFKEEV